MTDKDKNKDTLDYVIQVLRKLGHLAGGDPERTNKLWHDHFDAVDAGKKRYGRNKYGQAEKNKKGFQGMKGGGKVYASHNKRYAYGGKVSGRKATYKY